MNLFKFFEQISFWEDFQVNHNQNLERGRFFAWKSNNATLKTLLLANKTSQVSLIAVQSKILKFWREQIFNHDSLWKIRIGEKMKTNVVLVKKML